ncbi:MAG TPA: UDP-3-O-(3-hydroxymyristoyl)glucosamine N-acyltransferase [Phycisphaerales bacterium]|nr:UDP-3-O-(3-hydroxymyristoyl)glucosamine N-acyltransferase [Phycisphaerales bacterium]
MTMLTVKQLAERLGATLVGDGERPVKGCAPIERAGPDDLTFLANGKYIKFLETTKAAAVVISPKMDCPAQLTRLLADDPYFTFRNAVIQLHGFREHPTPEPDDPRYDLRNGAWIARAASIHPSATIAEGSVVQAFVTVEKDARIGKGCALYPGVFVGREATLGDECVLYPNVSVYERCVLGNRVHLHASTVVGHDGFGFATHKGAHHKIPQTGNVVIEDDVELGAGCAVERAAMGETRIGKGTKFADLISIGHGTTFGKHCLVVSLAGVAGSVEIGDYVVLGGQVGVSGHIKVGSGVQAMARTAIAQDVEPGLKVGGAPAIPYDQAKRNALAAIELYEMSRKLRQLERIVEDMRKRERETQNP